jgi:hypothetical protein
VEFTANDLLETLLLSERILILEIDVVLLTPLKSIELLDTPEPMVLMANALLTSVLFVELKSVELLTNVLFFVLNASEFEDTMLLEAFTANDLLETLLLSESILIDESVLVFAEPLKSIEDEETPEPTVLNANALLTSVLFVELTEKDLLYKSVLVDNILTLCKSRVFKFPLMLTELLFTISLVSKIPKELFDISEFVFLIDIELLLTVFPVPFISKDPAFKYEFLELKEPELFNAVIFSDKIENELFSILLFFVLKTVTLLLADTLSDKTVNDLLLELKFSDNKETPLNDIVLFLPNNEILLFNFSLVPNIPTLEDKLELKLFAKETEFLSATINLLLKSIEFPESVADSLLKLIDPLPIFEFIGFIATE